MTDEKVAATIDQAVEVLTGVAMNREEIKRELAKLPDDDPRINRTAVEYEIQLLRIVFTGWAVSYFMADHPAKNELAQAFWFSMHEFSGKISALASAGTAGTAIDYFEAIRERTRCYIDAMNANMTEADPTDVVGATFSQLCGDTDPQTLAQAGKHMFVNTLTTVKLYLDTVEINESPV